MYYYYSTDKPDERDLKKGFTTNCYNRDSISAEVSSLNVEKQFKGSVSSFVETEVIWLLKLKRKAKVLDLTSFDKLEEFYNSNSDFFIELPFEHKGSAPKSFITFNFEKAREEYDGFYINEKVFYYDFFLWTINRMFKWGRDQIISEGTIWFNWVFDEPIKKTIDVQYGDVSAGNQTDKRNSNKYLEAGKAKEKFSDSSIEDLMKKAKSKYMKPKRMKTNNASFNRSFVISLLAKIRANGICQLCEKPAPFKDRNGEPFLETHHIKWLSNGGLDTPENTIALCPNCHRKMHHLNLEEDVRKLIQKT
ncbi:HNH endonuclease [Halobacillus dabanensis]|uniref:HNH endonuclease n=1 Tax=Halobacillus dabanensis TaxID=240302 RepID=A0A1I3X033_HALDA|nr:HNH endonuclease signature motif containing protein [Halobacillus dabanensis]SFK12176.1 HNH endonuclease [Halobacillus dabanensis]